MKRQFSQSLLLATLLVGHLNSARAEETKLPLAGTWKFLLGAQDVGGIDNFVKYHKIGLIAETKVGKGNLLICAIDLLAHQDKPEARQMLYSLLRYVDSAAFAPRAELADELVKQ